MEEPRCTGRPPEEQPEWRFVASRKRHLQCRQHALLLLELSCPFVHFLPHKTPKVRLLARAEKADAVEDQAGLLPVHVAASAGQAPMVAYLAARSGVEVANRQGLSPLMCAAFR